MKYIYYIAFLFIIIVSANQPARGQTKEGNAAKFQPIGYKDANRDGINDLFSDAKGDGINDVTNKPYPHHFKFEDENKDGLNDLWIDKDGDGILDAGVKPEYDYDLRKFVLNTDNDSTNDITGLSVNNENTMGYRYGCIDEERNKKIKGFIDKNMDGMHDKYSNRLRNDLEQGAVRSRFDYFIDKDGDGISDGRGFGRKGKHQHGKRK